LSSALTTSTTKRAGLLEFVVRKTRVTNQRGEHIAELRTVTVIRNG
jgi:hypothetical protein